MKKITTKKQYDNAIFLGYQGKHVHNWKIFRADKTGAFLNCKICDEIVFIMPKELKKYRQYKKEGYSGNEIKVRKKTDIKKTKVSA